MRIILIAGLAGSGKTKLGELIVKYASQKGFKAIQTEYSKYLKLYAKEILGYDGNRDTKPRKFLQDEGSYIRENLHDAHFFTRRMLEDFRIYEKYADIVVISDVRLKREIEDIKNSPYENVYTIKVENPNLKSGLTKEEQNHITEKELENYENFDIVIVNENLKDLEENALKIVEGEM